jgi:nicotinate-nucleotide pyrophosphorylase (carboxylating)
MNGYLQAKVQEALLEDLGEEWQDPTTDSVVEEELQAEAVVVAKAAGVVAGLDAAAEVFRQIDREVQFRCLAPDGSAVQPGDVIARAEGPLRSLLKGERTALNFLQQLSGVASLTRRYVERARARGRALILDTRKTVPGLRPLQRHAVRAGGGTNHRYNLAAAVLIKDNHVEAAGGVGEAVLRARASGFSIELEVDNLAQLEEALELGVETILLDNFSPAEVAEAVALAGGRAVLEVSGGVNLENVGEYASSGVDRISVGALTHSAPALDISLAVVRTCKR